VRARPRSRAAKATGRLALESSPSERVAVLDSDRPDRLRAIVKRGSDIVVAVVMLTCLAPVFLLVAIAIRLDSRGPVLFRQRRVGRDGREFTMLKFRSMSADATPDAHRSYINALAKGAPPAAGAARGLLKLTRDGRITRVGAVLRKTSLDECPQLFNVLAGTMSIVGPRPALAYELELYRPEHFARFSVRPGITGLWQVCGRNRLDFYEMLDLDVEYAGRYGFARDAGLILRTPWAVVRAHTA
jgi:lipopolysaccharide/colanic/teichoic acid biosynthesis glycosyltransferase